MPIYEYKCRTCNKKFSLLFLKTANTEAKNCQYCHSSHIFKLPSAFCVQQSEGSRLADLDLSKPRNSEYYKDNRNIGLWAKKRMKQLGVKPTTQMEDMIERARGGNIPEEN